MNGNGNCYEIHAKYMLDENMSNTVKHDNMKLVHGEVTGQGPIKGIRHGHCWIEIDGVTVYDKANGRTVCITKELYYGIGNIKEEEVKRYTYTEVCEKLLKTKHFGPWD